MKKTLIAICSLFLINAVHAAENDNNKTYLEVGYTGLTYTEDPYTLSPTNLRFVLGKNEGTFGYEGMITTNTSSGVTTISSVDVNYKVNYIVGLYGKARSNLSDDLEVFGRLGWAKFDGTASASTISAGNSGSGLSYGVGAKYKISKSMNINLDYMLYYPKKDGISLTGYTLGVGFDF